MQRRKQGIRQGNWLGFQGCEWLLPFLSKVSRKRVKRECRTGWQIRSGSGLRRQLSPQL
ncbi:hypothetical protein GCM10007207_21730 [Asaia siamensis]|uniref:Uncharacterized protein n=1 Tax=Asaia siamensis TaxID=110479 RepID=A0ABQ1MBE9_9PROT|nr:hypothetical protein GCM10007207_21730 [Asaia siamensis]